MRSVVVAATSFLPLVGLLSKAEGMPDLRVAEYPGTIAIDSEEVIRENIAKMTFDHIVQALTEPVKSSAGIPGRGGTGETLLSGTFEEINRTFQINKWTDGLPIVPPTEEKVQEFLKFTGYAPNDEIAVLPVGNLRATPLKIAANGVMAGCRPEYMPILIAVVEAIADSRYDLEQLGTTAGLNPFLIINGPIVKQLGIQHGTGLVSRGPNPAIGRALGLIIRNIADFRAGEQYMGTFGYIMPFVVGEDEEASPWRPFHVDSGFDKNASTVTAGGTFNWGFQAFPSGTDPEGFLKIICREIVKHINLNIVCLQGHLQMMTVLITPSVAQGIARGGYSKQEAERYFYENSRVTIEEVSFESKYGNAGGGFQTIRGLRDLEWNTPKDWADLEGQDVTVPAMGFPGLIHIVVCGDRTRNKAMTLYTAYNRPTTKEIKLPPSWDKMMSELGYPPLERR
jgi:hypothetical protein